jgi:multidrug resistance efflux pump
MEPNLDDISDYKKPLSKNKKKIILIAFAIMIVIYALYVWVFGEY